MRIVTLLIFLQLIVSKHSYSQLIYEYDSTNFKYCFKLSPSQLVLAQELSGVYEYAILKDRRDIISVKLGYHQGFHSKDTNSVMFESSLYKGWICGVGFKRYFYTIRKWNGFNSFIYPQINYREYKYRNRLVYTPDFISPDNMVYLQSNHSKQLGFKVCLGLDQRISKCFGYELYFGLGIRHKQSNKVIYRSVNNMDNTTIYHNPPVIKNMKYYFPIIDAGLSLMFGWSKN